MEDVTVAKAGFVADHYSGRESQSRQQRQKSVIFCMRNLNNWVKSVLVARYVRADDHVFDLACGKGGDLPKFQAGKVAHWLGVDIARESVQRDARERYNAGGYHFTGQLMVADAFQVDLTPHVKGVGTYDLVSCQFAIHYAFASEERARQAFRNISAVLRPGGHFVGTTTDANVLVRLLRAAPGLTFGNRVYTVEFGEEFRSKAFTREFGNEYTFTLEDAVHKVPEYLVPFPTFERLAKEEGLELEMRANFHDFAHLQVTDFDCAKTAHMYKLFESSYEQMSADEWEAARIYCVFAFRKAGTPSEEARALFHRPKPGPAMAIQESEVTIVPGGGVSA